MATQRIVYSVSELNTATRQLLEQSFGYIWVEGEISNLARPRSGHIYFSIKDDKAQIRCALFRNKARLIRTRLEHGAQMQVRARVSLYPARGDFQLIVEQVEEAGLGALQHAFEQLRQRLTQEGLLASEQKLALPALPRRIGVITSLTGAALRDVISVLARRFPLGQLRVYPVTVQGTQAGPELTRAVQRAAQRRDCDVMLLVRGGGSLEDLWAFNDEALARAIVACPVPIVAGIGHEVDITIADLAADQRAATPSAAAESVCPDMTRLNGDLQRLQTHLRQYMQDHLRRNSLHLQQLVKRLYRQKPQRRLENAAQRLDELETRLHRSQKNHLVGHRARLIALQERLQRCHPYRRLARDQQHLNQLIQRRNRALSRILATKRGHLATLGRSLHNVSPLKTLERGYAIAYDAQNNILHDQAHVSPGQTISVNLARGRLDCLVQNRYADTK